MSRSFLIQLCTTFNADGIVSGMDTWTLHIGIGDYLGM